MFDRLAYQRAYRLRNANKHTKAYEKTINGFVMRAYRNMKSRIEGVQKTKFHLYEGKELMEKEVFRNLAISSPVFYDLFGNYKQSGWSRKLAPSLDRIDSKNGYTIDNVEWVTMSENSRRGSINRHKGI